MTRHSFSKVGIVITLLFFTAGCLSPKATPLKLDTYEGVEENEQVTLLKVIDERGGNEKYLGDNFIGYVIVPIMRIVHWSDSPVSEVMAQAFVQDLEKRGIRARYRPEYTAENTDRLPKDRAAVEIRIQRFEQQNNMVHLIFGFGPGGKWKTDIAFDYAVYKPGVSDPVKLGSVISKGSANIDFNEWKEKYDAGATTFEATELFQRRSLFQALDTAFDQFSSEANLMDLPAAAPDTGLPAKNVSTPDLI